MCMLKKMWPALASWLQLALALTWHIMISADQCLAHEVMLSTESEAIIIMPASVTDLVMFE